MDAHSEATRDFAQSYSHSQTPLDALVVHWKTTGREEGQWAAINSTFNHTEHETRISKLFSNCMFSSCLVQPAAELMQQILSCSFPGKQTDFLTSSSGLVRQNGKATFFAKGIGDRTA